MAEETPVDVKTAVADVLKETGFKPAQKDFIDSVVYDARKPNEYINKLKIGLKNNDKPSTVAQN